MDVDSDDTIFAEVDDELLNMNVLQDEHHISKDNNEETRKWELLRDSITAALWINYNEWFFFPYLECLAVYVFL